MKKRFLSFFIFIILIQLSGPINAQVGINTTTPDQSAVLELFAPNGDQGLLVPRIEDLADINEPANGLLVFNTTDSKFYFCNRPDANPGTWCEVNPLTKINGGTEITASNNLNVTGNVTSTGTVTANSFAGNGTIPVGGIIMWSGDPNDLPAGWELCDGVGGRPNLKGRFIVGYDAASGTEPVESTDATQNYGAIHNKGGRNGVTLTANESGLRDHNHVVKDDGHSHSYINYPSAGVHRRGNNAADHTSYNVTGTSNQTDNIRAGIELDPAVPLDAIESHENRPPYYVLAFIIRVQ